MIRHHAPFVHRDERLGRDARHEVGVLLVGEAEPAPAGGRRRRPIPLLRPTLVPIRVALLLALRHVHHDVPSVERRLVEFECLLRSLRRGVCHVAESPGSARLVIAAESQIRQLSALREEFRQSSLIRAKVEVTHEHRLVGVAAERVRAHVSRHARLLSLGFLPPDTRVVELFTAAVEVDVLTAPVGSPMGRRIVRVSCGVRRELLERGRGLFSRREQRERVEPPFFAIVTDGRERHQPSGVPSRVLVRLPGVVASAGAADVVPGLDVPRHVGDGGAAGGGCGGDGVSRRGGRVMIASPRPFVGEE